MKRSLKRLTPMVLCLTSNPVADGGDVKTHLRQAIDALEALDTAL
jgi:hypothetical protein